MEQIFKFIDDRGYFVSDINKPGSYNAETDQLTGYYFTSEGYQGFYNVAYRELRPIQNPPTWFLRRGEIVKHTITSSKENRKINVYYDDSVKVFDYGQNYTQVTDVGADEMLEIIDALKAGKIIVNYIDHTKGK